MAAPIYDLRDVVRERSRGGARFTLEVPEFCVRAGEFVAVVGESGCGKSTLLDLLGLVLRAERAGRFSCAEVEISTATPEAALARLRRAEIGYVLQSGGLLRFLTVRQNIALPGRINGTPNIAARVEALAERLGIASQLDKTPGALSGGQRQRAAIARALIHEPRVVLADEPTAAVDEKTAGEIVEHFRALCAERGLALLLVTHNLPLVARRADRFFSFELSRPGPQAVHSLCHEIPRPI